MVVDLKSGAALLSLLQHFQFSAAAVQYRILRYRGGIVRIAIISSALVAGTFAGALGGFGVAVAAEPLTAPVIPVLDSRAEKSRIEQEKLIEARAQETNEQRLDRLFAELRRTSNEAAAKRIAAQIQTIWNRSGSATIDLLMQWASGAMLEKKYDVASDFLDEAVALMPDYAEIWNRRAMLHMLKKQPDRAIYDVNKAIELEPRHYSSLIILATLMEDRGLKERAMQVYGQALELYPMMRDIQNIYAQLAEELAEIRT